MDRPQPAQHHYDNPKPLGNLQAQNIKSMNENAIPTFSPSPNEQNLRSIERDDQDDVLNGLA